MLPAAHRMRHSADFEQAVRRGARAGRETLVVHLTTRTDPGPTGPVVGFVVSKAVGNAVVRNRVKRRLRALVGERIAALPASTSLVVRAQVPAATATYDRLGTDLDGALRTAARRAEAGR
ncbi:ribonuclease P protein component [Cellulomonas uda]|uniref:Ribonuclease P protein component n=1 Tax=Cellulomonas uda TaxID=1714 RepID=A0A4Y3KHW6_CELUD|nr:ribonuclease P protein component [Cellulomonas uda]NII66368.1 ribonuclease P protein component [Cellulomonas uda]GEA82655.1 ribonuclease P protein component [Cellulomonas uda]